MEIRKLSEFLRGAKENTYASEKAEKVTSLRPGSNDYEYSEGNLVYHDTYFGGSYFIGEEIVYESGKPVWGMNYNGYVIGENVTEADIDKSLRPALKALDDEIIPVRGPKEFINDNYKYSNVVTGRLDRFEGREEITRDDKLIYYAVYHGGMIK